MYDAAKGAMTRRQGSRIKSKKQEPRKARVKVKIKAEGSPEQVKTAIRKIVGGKELKQESK